MDICNPSDATNIFSFKVFKVKLIIVSYEMTFTLFFTFEIKCVNFFGTFYVLDITLISLLKDFLKRRNEDISLII